MNMVGTQLGKYRIVSEIGSGGMAQVYEAIDTTIDRTVALKIMTVPSSLGEDGMRFIQRFKREARAAGILSHPNIVTIYEVGEAAGEHYIAMELLHGTTVRRLLQFSGPLPQDKVVEIALQVCDALIAAHEQGIIHQDIKPDNIIIRGDGLVKITDFGIARAISDIGVTQTAAVKGSPAYMSPEQIQAQPIDARTDIFALGVTLYEMLTGVRPFEAETITASIYRTLHEEPDLSVLPESIREIVGKALAKNPEHRFPTAHEIKAALQALAPAGTQAAEEPSAPSAAWVPARKGLPDIALIFLIPFSVLLGACATFLAMQLGPLRSSSEDRVRVTTLILDRGREWHISRDRDISASVSLQIKPGAVKGVRLDGLALQGASSAWIYLDVPRKSLRRYGDTIAVDLYLPPNAPKGILARFSIQGEGWKPREYVSQPARLVPGRWTTLSWQADDTLANVRRVLLSFSSRSSRYNGYVEIANLRITGEVK